MKINKKISKYNNQSRGGQSVKYIVIHYVGAVSTAKNNADYFAGGNRNASAHYFVDDSSVWQSVETSRAAWHCGGGLQGSTGHTFFGKCTNNNSIGIEMCCKAVGGQLVVSDKTEANTVELVKKLMKDFKVPASNVIRHWDVTGKNCPGLWTGATNSRWSKFKKKLTGTATSAAPASSAKTTTAAKKTSTTSTTSKKKSTTEIAKEVIAGKWGNGEDRKKKLTAAGYNYTTIQNKVNELLSVNKTVSSTVAKKTTTTKKTPTKKTTTKKKTTLELAYEVIEGKWGNGEDRKKKLTAAGYDYKTVQAKVNALLK